MKFESNSNRKKRIKLISLIFKLTIIGIGYGVLAGTFLKIVPKQTFSNHQIESKSNLFYSPNFDYEYNEVTKISSSWEKINNRHEDIEISGYALFSDGSYAETNSNKIFLPSYKLGLWKSSKKYQKSSYKNSSSLKRFYYGK